VAAIRKPTINPTVIYLPIVFLPRVPLDATKGHIMVPFTRSTEGVSLSNSDFGQQRAKCAESPPRNLKAAEMVLPLTVPENVPGLDVCPWKTKVIVIES
jgi:hypothetical protein